MAGKFNYLTLQSKCVVIVIAFTSQFASVNSRYYVPTEDEPKALLSWNADKFPVGAPIIPDACKEAVLCEYVINHPTELVTMIFNKLSLKNITKFTNEDIDEIEYDNDLGEIQDLCESKKEKIIFPRAAKDQDNNWQFILNMEGRKFQSFRVHECLNGHEVSCSQTFFVKNTMSYSLECEEEFAKRKMVYLNLEKRVVETSYFEVPSCCSCFLKPR
ncbi:protein spaetzle-like [Pararge aegeria]|uniref:Jg16228 protein n=1 Tax=Pararge aegeria aegeria TaxID=348720 RepID=A0A8S4RX99_9NEOP|nr:protein spaetzle-like [Pararge aegeria]CAH2241837.1 jg16228 [Pararge aegeria aegeria]